MQTEKKNTIRTVFKIIVFIVAIVAFCSIFDADHRSKYSFRLDFDAPSRRIVIYTATPFFGSPMTNSDLKKCSQNVKNYCTISTNISDLATANGVVFHSRDFNEQKMSEFSENRNPDQLFVIMAMESPFFARLFEYQHFFNWTMTYKMSSDVFHPYGTLVKHENGEKFDYEKLWKSKNKTAIWLVSNGNSVGNKRDVLVEKMVESGMEIDLLGRLFGKEPPGCGRMHASNNCEPELFGPYKFSIAFENNNCKDYVTEKFWRKSGFGTVPIVMTRKIYRELGIPDSMYIAVDDFPKLEDFVAHVKNVSGNKTAYLEYHKWREDFRIAEVNSESVGMCQLCQKLYNFHGSPKKSYANMLETFSKSDCDNSFVSRY